MATKAQITGSFLGRMLFKFVLICVLWAISVITLNNYLALPSSGSQIATRNDSGGYASVIISSIGIFWSSFQLMIIVLVDINGSILFEPLASQGQDFCVNDTGRVSADNQRQSSTNGILGNNGNDDRNAFTPQFNGGV